MAPVAWELLLFLDVRYVSLITCCSAGDDAMGTRLTLRGPRGVIRITWEVIDKVGLNRLFDPHQSPFLSPIQSSLLPLSLGARGNLPSGSIVSSL
jgi:hypothetical protein